MRLSLLLLYYCYIVLFIFRLYIFIIYLYVVFCLAVS